ncbi:MAG: hypothetical protein IKZ53_05645 [Selenomonadaceae bacterium]|nr:hypothetical protein [Selenomonadaceae bacterium]
MKIGISTERLVEARCSQAYFGRLVGLSRQRINQLLKLGIIEADEAGVKLFRSLENYFVYTKDKRLVYKKWRIFS